MYIFWDNILKFPQFFISVLLGFFLTISSSLFELLRGPKQGIIITVAFGIGFILLTNILKLMLAVN